MIKGQFDIMNMMLKKQPQELKATPAAEIITDIGL